MEAIKSVGRIFLALVIIVSCIIGILFVTDPINPTYRLELNDDNFVYINSKSPKISGKFYLKESLLRSLINKEKYFIIISSENTEVIQKSLINSKDPFELAINNFNVNDKVYPFRIFDSKDKVVFTKEYSIKVDDKKPELNMLVRYPDNTIMMEYDDTYYLTEKKVNISLRFNEEINMTLDCIANITKCESVEYNFSKVQNIELEIVEENKDSKFKYRVIDKAGNEISKEIVLKYDSIAPKITITSSLLVPFNSNLQNYKIQFKTSEPLSFVTLDSKFVQFDKKNNVYYKPYIGLKAGDVKTFKIVAYDYVGNKFEKTYTLRVAKPKPVATISCEEHVKQVCASDLGTDEYTDCYDSWYELWCADPDKYKNM